MKKLVIQDLRNALLSINACELHQSRVSTRGLIAESTWPLRDKIHAEVLSTLWCLEATTLMEFISEWVGVV